VEIAKAAGLEPRAYLHYLFETQPTVGDQPRRYPSPAAASAHAWASENSGPGTV